MTYKYPSFASHFFGYSLKATCKTQACDLISFWFLPMESDKT